MPFRLTSYDLNRHLQSNIKMIGAFSFIRPPVDPNYIEFNITLLGDPNVGKTSLFDRLTTDNFQQDPTNLVLGEKMAKFMFCDPVKTNEETLNCYVKRCIEWADGIILVYDLTNRSSFLNLQKWLSEIKSNGESNMLILLVGNKCDLQTSREVTLIEGLEMVRKEANIILHLETSAVENVNIDTAFNYIRKSFVERWRNDKCQIL